MYRNKGPLLSDYHVGWHGRIPDRYHTGEGDHGGTGILSSISLPSDYGGTDQKTRLAFVGYNSTSGLLNNDVYRIDDDLSPRVQRLNVTGGDHINISSIAYFGTQKSGKLLAGFAEPSGTKYGAG